MIRCLRIFPVVGALVATTVWVGSPTVANAAAPPVTIATSVKLGADDAEEISTGRVDLTSTALDLGNGQVVGIRFDALAIPPGATITAASIQFTTSKASTKAASLVVRAQAADSAAPFTKVTRNVSSRARTTASVPWAPAGWVRAKDAGLAQRTPDLAPLVREVVGRAGWTSGNAIVFLVTGTGVRLATAREASGPPVLSVEFIPPGGDEPPTTEFLTVAEALARPNVIVETGLRDTQLRVGAPPNDTTYDLRGLVSQAYRTGITEYPVTFGSTTPPSGLVLVGGEVQGQNPESWTWQDWEAELKTGGAFYVSAADAALFGGRANNVFDFVKVQRRTPTARYLVEGCYGRYVRDDAIENDEEASITVRDCLFDGISMGVSIAQELPNATAVTAVHDTTFIFEAMPNTTALDGLGHGRLFKQLGGGTVDFRNVTVCYPENPMSSPDKLGLWMPGTYSNVRIVLGAAFTESLTRFGTLPAGVTISRDWTICDQARSAWLAAH